MQKDKNPEKQTRIAIDMDEVMADVYPKFLDIYEAQHGRRPEYSEYAGGKIYDCVPGAEQLRSELHNEGFFRDLPLMEGVVPVVRDLNKVAELIIVTSAQEFRNSLIDKYDWLQQHFPFLSWKQYVFVGAKHFINADYLIDDHLKNLRGFEGTGVLFDAPHNEGNEDYVRVHNWEEIRTYFEGEGILEAQ